MKGVINMAQRRMISLSVIDTDKFIDMPASTRLLYYDLSMRADDDGFVSSPKKTIRMIGADVEDLERLIESGYLIRFDSGIVVIRHWKVNNQLRKDRYIPTVYQKEFAMLQEADEVYYLIDDNQPTTKCQPPVNQTAPQDSIGEDRLGEDRSDKDSTDGGCDQPRNESSLNYESIVDSFNRLCPSLPKVRALTENRRMLIQNADKLIGGDFENLFRKAEASDYLTGKVGSWRADFDWVLKDDNPLKILEGKYDTFGKQNKSSFDIEELERM